MHYIVIETRF